MSSTAFRIAFVVSVVAACGGARNPYDVPITPQPVAPPPPESAPPPADPTSEPMEPLDPGPPLGDLPQLPPPPSAPSDPQRTTLTPDQIRRVVAAHTGAMRRCYQQALVQSPNASGKVVLGWKIEANGTTSDVAVKSSTLKLPKAESCMLQQVQSWKFPQAAGPIVLSYPFVFANAGSQPTGR